MISRTILILSLLVPATALGDDSLLKKAAAEERAGNYSDSIADVATLLQSDPNNAEAYNIRAAAYSNLGKRDLARADLTVAIQLRPDDADYRFARGLAWDRDAFDRVVEDFDSAVRLNPNDAELRDKIANAWMRRKQFERADETSKRRLS